MVEIVWYYGCSMLSVQRSTTAEYLLMFFTYILVGALQGLCDVKSFVKYGYQTLFVRFTLVVLSLPDMFITLFFFSWSHKDLANIKY